MTYRPSTSVLTWRKKDGTKILIKDMDDNHLINCLRLMKRAVLTAQVRTRYPAVSLSANNWREFLPSPTRERVYFMETECIKRGICWNDEGDIGGAGGLPEKKLSAKSDVCSECRFSLVCMGKKFVVRKCVVCGKCFVSLGGALRDQFVHPDCPRLVTRASKQYQKKCYLCAQELRDKSKKDAP